MKHSFVFTLTLCLLAIFQTLPIKADIILPSNFSHPTEVECIGTVVDQSDGTPIYGVAIVIEGTSQGTMTDKKGRFAIKAKPGQSLCFSFVGYADEVIKVGKKHDRTMKVVLKQEIIYLDITPSPATKSQPSEISANDEVFTLVADQASFPGGNITLKTFIDEHLQHPVDAQQKKLQGCVMLAFDVNADGTLSNFEGLKSPSELLTQAAIEMAKQMPKWNPSKQRGRCVKTRVAIPIEFK